MQATLRRSESQSGLNRSKCLICSLRNQGDPAETAFTAKGFRIARCRNCQLMWTETSPSFDAKRLYTREYFQGGAPDGYSDYLGSEPLLQREFESRLSLVRSFTPAGQLFEIGCATGGFLQEARKYFNVEGTDVSNFAVEVAREKGLEVRCGEFHPAYARRTCYDVFALFDTIEHLPSPADTLWKVHGCLRPGGSLFLTTGDSGSLVARVLGSRWHFITPPQRLWFFNRKNITELLGRVGFKVVAVRYPWRNIPLEYIWYQAFRGGAKPLPPAGRSIRIPLNLFDSMMVVGQKL